MKYTYYVALIKPDGSFEYVTRQDNRTHTFYCEEGQPAKKFKKTRADELMYGMYMNDNRVAVIKVPEHYTFVNPVKEAEDSGN